MKSGIEAQNQQNVTILIAEDDDGHAELIREHLEDVGIRNPMIRFANGKEVWDFLSFGGPGPHRQRNQAYLLLLDIRMPKMDGVEVLRRIKADEALHSLPVIMLTTTNDPREVQECYKLGCNSYVTKPVNYEQFTQALERLGLFLMIIQISQLNGHS